MSQKIILTESQHRLIVNEIVNEMLKDIDSNILLGDEPINENVLEKIKYGLSKLGRYKAGGKIFGKSKVDQEAAAKIQQILDKKENEVIKNLDSKIKETNPEFPNNEKQADFLSTIIAISAVYDELVKSAKDPESITIANGVIAALREYVKKFLDVDLKAIYSVVDEAEGNIIELTEEELKQLDEDWGLNTEDYLNEEIIDEDQAGDVRKDLQAKRGAGDDFQSDRMKTLKSNKLPLILAGVGGALGALGWIAQTEWFKVWLEGLLGADTTITEPDIVKNVTGGAPDSKGMLHWMGQIDNSQMKTGADVQAFIEKYGADNVKHMFEGNGGGSIDTQIQQLQQLVGGENSSKSVGELFNPSNDTFGSMKGGQNLFGVSKAASFLAKIVIKKGATTLVKGAGTALAAKLAGLGAVLAPIGLTILGTGALVKLMRLKGQKWSRAATLNALYQSLREIEGGILPTEGPTIDKDVSQDPKAIDDKNKEEGGKGGSGAGQAGGGINDDLYNSIRNLFQFLVNNKDTLGTRSGTNVGSTGVDISNQKFYTGEKIMYKGEPAEIIDINQDNTAVINKLKEKKRVKVKLSSIEKFNKGHKILYKGKPAEIISVNQDNTVTIKRPKATKSFNVKIDNIEKLPTQKNTLQEGKYIKDEKTKKFLEKKLTLDKLKNFEDFIGRVEILRNKIKKIKTNDKSLNVFLNQINSNPIMLTDFNKLFNIPSDNLKGLYSLKGFIDEIFVTIYSGSLSKNNMNNLIKAMGSAGGNVNKLEEELGYNINEPSKAFVKDAQDRSKFKNNLLKFLQQLINIFEELNKLKSKGKLAQTPKPPTPNKKQAGDQQQTPSEPETQQQTPSEPDAQQQAKPKEKSLHFKGIRLESKLNNKNKLISEEINKINKLINKIN